MNTDHQFSYWEKDTFLKPYDLVVVGAGIVGLTAALFYKREHPGSRVAVLEKGFMPEGASTRNAGFACVGSVGEHMADLQKDSQEVVRQRISARYEGLRLLKKTLGENDIGYEPCGGYELFTGEEAFERAAGRISFFNGWMEELTGEEEVYAAGSLNGYDVIHNRLEGALHPGMMMAKLIRMVSETGIEIKWNSPVREIRKPGRIVLEDGLYLQGERVLVSVNGFVKKLLPGIPVQAARGLVLVTSPLKHLPWRGTFHHDRGYVYFRDLGDRLLIGGARNIDREAETTADFGVNRKIREHLAGFARDVLKIGENWSVDHEWSGIMGFTPSKSPVVEPLGEGLFVAAGLSGMGIAIGTEVGKRAAALLDVK